MPGDLGPEVELEVRPASAGPLIGGVVLMGSGGAFVLVGLLLVAFADVGGLSVDGSGSSHSRANNTELKNTGYVFMGIGAAAAAGGLVWLLTRSHEPRVHEAPARGSADVYGRNETLLGDVAAAKPRDPASTLLPAFTPLTYRFAF